MIIECPHCKEPVIIIKKKCGIFRHGVIIKTNKQMKPHLSKEECEKLINSKAIYGCGKPFRILEDDSVTVCEYI